MHFNNLINCLTCESVAFFCMYKLKCWPKVALTFKFWLIGHHCLHFHSDQLNMNFMNFKALRIKFEKFKTIIKFENFERHNYGFRWTCFFFRWTCPIYIYKSWNDLPIVSYILYFYIRTPSNGSLRPTFLIRFLRLQFKFIPVYYEVTVLLRRWIVIGAQQVIIVFYYCIVWSACCCCRRY